ncbi:hypothetical protein GN244_ATG14143 [Phytophthora infestans]|uniref:Uncharacterized protein n=1 Tax=Phytophthora infestans TaxID=4787 RepID=A0A833VYF1_PHYIN|nr:hypothetical protein GN244_ATG14143 [Phytophthora infestans]KAF4144349.1 hypothetical protein GN958_ATG06443 [Phytophthora infestans]
MRVRFCRLPSPSVYHYDKHVASFTRYRPSSALKLNAVNSLELCQTRRYSSQPDNQKRPAEGFQEVLDTLARVRDRKGLLEEYKTHGVFAPSSMSWLANWLMFYHLNRPQHTQLDLVDFIQGAKYAMGATMTAMYSNEFADYVAREAEAPGPLKPDCESAEMVERSLETVSYKAFKSFVLQSASAGVRAEMKKIEVHSAHLMSVQYERVAKRSTTNSSGATVLGVPVDERLKLAVLFDITERVSMTLPDSDDAEEIARSNKAIWQFESVVTKPEDIDWIIEPLHLTA